MKKPHGRQDTPDTNYCHAECSGRHLTRLMYTFKSSKAGLEGSLGTILSNSFLFPDEEIGGLENGARARIPNCPAFSPGLPVKP